jgi:protein Tob/BTG
MCLTTSIPSMKLELQSASNFLCHLVRLGRRNITEQQLLKFQQCLQEVLRRRYRDHWFPEKPFKGSGYRCIRINGKMDPVIVQAAEGCALQAQLIHATFPSELTMWIDPLEVSYRIGENGSICVLYEFKDGAGSEAWRPTPSLSQPSSSSSPSALSKNINAKNHLMESESHPAVAVAGMDRAECKASIRDMDYLLDPRKSVSIEQLAAYVSS